MIPSTRSDENSGTISRLASGLRIALSVAASIVLTAFAGVVLLNLILSTAVQLFQLAIWGLLLVPSIPALYAMDSTRQTMRVRVLLGLLSVVLWIAAFVAILRFD